MSPQHLLFTEVDLKENGTLCPYFILLCRIMSMSLNPHNNPEKTEVQRDINLVSGRARIEIYISSIHMDDNRYAYKV